MVVWWSNIDQIFSGAQDKVHRRPVSCDDRPSSQSELLCLVSPFELAESISTLSYNIQNTSVEFQWENFNLANITKVYCIYAGDNILVTRTFGFCNFGHWFSVCAWHPLPLCFIAELPVCVLSETEVYFHCPEFHYSYFEINLLPCVCLCKSNYCELSRWTISGIGCAIFCHKRSPHTPKCRSAGLMLNNELL